jgi:superoxide dismutase, Fe-Mn family
VRILGGIFRHRGPKRPGITVEVGVVVPEARKRCSREAGMVLPGTAIARNDNTHEEAIMATATARAPSALHFDLAPLPFDYEALEPILSAETLSLHHDKHHRKYVETMNQLLAQAPIAKASSLQDVVRASSGKLFNNAAQAWNHDFYWHSLSPKRSRAAGALLHRIEKDFGSYERFSEAFAKAAIEQFGSGWAWLVQKDGKLEVTSTSNADTPMARGVRCLLTLDVWEHAYYVDYRNERERYVSALNRRPPQLGVRREQHRLSRASMETPAHIATSPDRDGERHVKWIPLVVPLSALFLAMLVYVINATVL